MTARNALCVISAPKKSVTSSGSSGVCFTRGFPSYTQNTRKWRFSGKKDKEVSSMPRTHPPDVAEYWRRIVELARAGRSVASWRTSSRPRRRANQAMYPIATMCRALGVSPQRLLRAVKAPALGAGPRGCRVAGADHGDPSPLAGHLRRGSRRKTAARAGRAQLCRSSTQSVVGGRHKCAMMARRKR